MNLEQARFNMVEQQVRPWDVLDPKVLELMETVPRDAFVPEDHKNLAYADIEIPLGHGECMMAPKVEGRMLQALAVQPTDVALEIGTGSGYVTALLAKLAGHVHSVEIIDEFKHRAGRLLAEHGIDNVTLRTGDASRGWNHQPRYDVIAVTGSLPEYHDGFEARLALGGRLFVVVGEAPVMEAMLITRVGENEFRREMLFETDLKALTGTEKHAEFVL
ncbi:MAG TPA: protein-L-isoaspartate O-methyltransferase [Thioalkalivibrio sp.]|nr:protein-L-isoaspartate O-methyltransferase [Thioalkalivibrio sp.]